MTELGYYLTLTQDNFATIDEYNFIMSYKNDYVSLLNIFDNMVITMSTIGFGNFYVQDGLSRMFIFLVSIAAIITFPMYVVAITNYLDTDH